MTTINERIRTIIDVLYRGNVTDFANSIGCGASTIYAIVGKRQPSPTFTVISSIYESLYARGLSAHWLLTGEGEMTKKALMEAYTKGVNDQIERTRAFLTNNKAKQRDSFYKNNE